MIDLHTHSTASDGSYSPTALVDLAAQIGLEALALTDHDTVSGVAEAREACDRRGVRFFAGVELEVEFHKGTFHLLGLGLTEAPERVERMLRELKHRRHRRNLGIIGKMRDDGVEVDLAMVASFAGGEVLGRPHFARFLVSRGVARSVQDAFDRFLGREKKYYLPIEHLSVEESAGIVHRAGGKAIVAHPLTLGLELAEIEDLLPVWKERGIEGIEAFHSNAPLAFCEAVEKMARRNGLFVTAGSDFHGSVRPERKLGRTTGGREIDSRFLEVLS